MVRKLRAAAQAAAQSMRTAPPSLPDASDEEMADAPPTRESSVGDVAQDDPDDDPDDDPEVKREPVPEPDEEEAAPSPAPELDAPEEPYTPRGGRTSAIPRKRRLGRPPKNRPPDWDLPDDPNAESQIRVTTPVKRRRGRPAASGGRWGRRGGTPHVTKVAVDKEGTMLDVVDDEVVLPDDPDGETKVDKMGNLLGGRQYRVRTFTILNRGDRKYMLSTEPARCIGFRDSYLFFQKHKLLYKIIIDDDAKRDLIERDIIPHSYKGRAIGVVTARSVFREFGAKIVIGGRKVNDDYAEQAARERGDIEGELAVPEDKLPAPGEEYNRNQYVAWHGASAVYHTGAPSVPLPNGKIVDPKKRKVTVTGDNWMIEHAREASRYNSSTASLRRDNLDGVYDVHTNFMHYPKIMQPSHARWERLPPADSTASSKLMDSMSTLRLSNGTSGADEESPATHGEHEENESSEENPSMFAPVPSVFTRRFAITDIQYETAESSTLGRPGPDGDVHDIGVNGVISMADPLHPEFVSADVLAELPLDCKDALVDAAAREWEWKSKWRTEATDAARSAPLKSYSWYP